MKILMKILCLVAVAGVTAGCRADSLTNALPAGSVDYCTIMADPPFKAGKTIVGPGRYRCDGKGADTITLTVTLQRKTSTGLWQGLKRQTFVAHGTATSRSLSEGDRTRKVVVVCGVGQYRTLVHSVEKSKGHTATYDMHSAPVPNPCRI